MIFCLEPSLSWICKKKKKVFTKFVITLTQDLSNHHFRIPLQDISTCRKLSLYALHIMFCCYYTIPKLCVLLSSPYPPSVIDHSWEKPNQEKVWAIQLPSQ